MSRKTLYDVESSEREIMEASTETISVFFFTKYYFPNQNLLPMLVIVSWILDESKPEPLQGSISTYHTRL